MKHILVLIMLVSFSIHGEGIKKVKDMVEKHGRWDYEEEWGAGHKGYIYLKDVEKDTYITYMFIKKDLYSIRETYTLEDYNKVYNNLVEEYGEGTGNKNRMNWEDDNIIIWLTVEGEEVMVRKINKY